MCLAALAVTHIWHPQLELANKSGKGLEKGLEHIACYSSYNLTPGPVGARGIPGLNGVDGAVGSSGRAGYPGIIRWLVGTVDLGTVEIRYDFFSKKSNILKKKFRTLRIAFVNNETIITQVK